jgi:hypothetical protein
LKNAACSFRMFVHVVATEVSFFFNQYFNWSKFWIWYDVEAASNSSFISFVEIMIDSRRVSLIDRFDDFDSTDCLSLKTIFSCIMIVSYADDFCRYDSNWCLIRSSWLIQNNFKNLSADDRQRTQQRQDLKVLYRFRIAKIKKVNIMSRTIIR